MITEINWRFTLSKNGEILLSGCLSTIDLSFPHTYFNQLAARYGHCRIVVHNSVGEIYEKEWP